MRAQWQQRPIFARAHTYARTSFLPVSLGTALYGEAKKATITYQSAFIDSRAERYDDDIVVLLQWKKNEENKKKKRKRKKKKMK